MTAETSIRCPACGKGNSFAAGTGAESRQPSSSCCSRCGADLGPLLRIRRAGLRMHAQVLREIGQGRSDAARKTRDLLRDLSPQDRRKSVALRKLFS